MLRGFAQFVNATTEEDLDKAGQHLANFVATVGIDIVLSILVKKAAGKAKNYGDDLNSVDEVSAHSDDVTLGRVNDVNNANKTPSTDTQVIQTTDNDIKYPEGISYRQDLPKHLKTFDVFTQKNGVGGSHNLDAFNQAVAEKGIRITSKTEHPTIKGIYQIEYEIPILDKQRNPTGIYKKIKNPKTVYDPVIHSDEKILQLSIKAAAIGLDNAISKGLRQFTQKVDDITFRVYLDLQSKTVTNVHPDFNNGH